jgi:NADH dehydrogenase
MRIAITGGTGFVGTAVARALLDGDHEVVLVSRGMRTARAEMPGVRHATADLTTGRGLAEAFAGCDAVVHLAAVIVERGRQTFDRVNRLGTATTARAAVEAGVSHLIHLSAIGADPDPRFPYLDSKWAGEQAVRNSGVPFTVIRSSVIFGPGDGFFTKLATLVRRTPPLCPLPIAGDGRALFQPIAATDVARCIVLALDSGPSRTTLSIGGPDHLSYEQIIDIIKGEVVSLPRFNVHVPVMAIKPMIAMTGALTADPLVTPDQLDLLRLDSITRPNAVLADFGFVPRGFAANCSYLRKGRRGRAPAAAGSRAVAATVSSRLAELGIRLPASPAAVGSYVPARRSGDRLHLSGHLSRRDGQVVTGRVGQDIDVKTARALARQVAIDLVGTAADAAGGVDRLAGVIKLTGWVCSAPGFTQQPAVVNGASDCLVEIFGEAGRHARSAIGVSELPLGAALEIEAVFSLS